MSLGCGHRLCLSCWKGYLVTAVNDGKLCIVYRCPGFKCPILVPDRTFKNLTESVVQEHSKMLSQAGCLPCSLTVWRYFCLFRPDVFARHQHYLLRSYVEDNRSLRWCPGARCNLAIRALRSSVQSVKCTCGHASCFQCGEESHAPVTCKQLAEWNDKCKNESETAHWIIAKSDSLGARRRMLDYAAQLAHLALWFIARVLSHSTKKCPKCGVRIEKSQGCNHVRS